MVSSTTSLPRSYRKSGGLDRQSLAKDIGDTEFMSGAAEAPQRSVLLSQGLRFGQVPPDERKLARTFLKEDGFLLTSPNACNTLGLGTTQLYNTRVVHNHKRYGRF